MPTVKNEKYQIKSDCYFNELGWNLRCEFTNLITGECQLACPNPNVTRMSESEAENDAVEWGKSFVKNGQLGF